MNPDIPTSASQPALPQHLAWRQLLGANLCRLSPEKIAIDDAPGRVSAVPITACSPLPRFSESLRDGFLCYRADLAAARSAGLEVVCEVAAGCADAPRLERRTAQRVFTGAAVGAGEGAAVVPFEMCRFDGTRVYLEKLPSSSCIRRRGQECAAGEQLFPGGHRLTAADAALAAACGVEEITVSRRPRVAVCCTGSELVRRRARASGQKRSVNHILLSDGLARCGAEVVSLCHVVDEREPLREFFAADADLLLSSGGMGPGKYDFGRDVFAECGGDVLLTTLAMQPGKSLLAGRLNRAVVLGLPGPPRAVETLVAELVVPVCRLLEGEDPAACWPQIIELPLLCGGGRKALLPNMKGGRLVYSEGRCLVRPVEDRERPDCHILYPNKRPLEAGEPVEVHLLPR